MNRNMIWGIVLLALSLYFKPLLAIVGLNERILGLYWHGEAVFTLNPIIVQVILGAIGIMMLMIGVRQVAKQKNT
ncbi:hypothetical protein ACX93W_03615 [Paenibacillus sp. CAU 1782]